MDWSDKLRLATRGEPCGAGGEMDVIAKPKTSAGLFARDASNEPRPLKSRSKLPPATACGQKKIDRSDLGNSTNDESNNWIHTSCILVLVLRRHFLAQEQLRKFGSPLISRKKPKPDKDKDKETQPGGWRSRGGQGQARIEPQVSQEMQACRWSNCKPFPSVSAIAP